MAGIFSRAAPGSRARPLTRAGAVAAVAALLLAGCIQDDGDGDGDGTTEAGDKWCSDVSIAAFPGGDEGTPFTNNVYNGYEAAREDLGPEVTYYYSGWDTQRMITQFQEALAQNPDGMAVMGHPGDESMDPLIDEAFEAGIQVTVVNVELPEALAAHQGQGLGYAGAPNYAAGQRLAEEALARSGAGPGEKAFVWGLLAQPGRGERTRGIVETFEEAELEVVYQEIDEATNADAQAGTPTFTGVMAADPDISIVVTDHGALTSTAQTYMEAAGLEPGSVYFAGFDLGPATVEAVQNGFLNLVIDQQPFLQGYLPILQICLTEKYGFSGLYVDTAGAFVDESNIDAIAPLAEQEIR
jgi:simple sugar transport system substrate-binding protein